MATVNSLMHIPELLMNVKSVENKSVYILLLFWSVGFYPSCSKIFCKSIYIAEGGGYSDFGTYAYYWVLGILSGR